MKLDEIESLATNVVGRDAVFRANMNELRRIEAINSLLGHGLVACQNANDLARFILDVLPTLRAAEAWADADENDDGQECGRLMEAIDQLRKAGG